MATNVRYYDSEGNDITDQFEDCAFPIQQLSLRDFFAGCALIGITIACPHLAGREELAFAQADAMLKEREGRE